VRLFGRQLPFSYQIRDNRHERSISRDAKLCLMVVK
jgi:hypothetical protein